MKFTTTLNSVLPKLTQVLGEFYFLSLIVFLNHFKNNQYANN